MRDFTLEKYDLPCVRPCMNAGYVGMGIGDYLARGGENLPDRLVLLRHDVDSRASYSLKLAEIEQQYQSSGDLLSSHDSFGV